METPRVRLGELLVRAGLISAAQLTEALGEQQRIGKRLSSLLVESGLVSETQVTQILSQQLSVPWVSLHHIDFSRELLNLVPVDAVERFCLIPIYVRRVRGLGDALYVAMDDPTNAQALAEVAERSGLHVRAMIAPPSDIRAAIRAYYGIGPEPASPSPLQPKLADVEESVATGIVSRADVESQAAQAAIALGQAGMDLAPAEPGRAAAGEAPLAAIAPAKKPARLPTGSAAAAAASPASEASTAIASDPASAAAPSTKKGEPGARRAPGERARMAKASPGRKMIALTLLDGTTIRLPSKGKGGGDGAEGGESDDSPEGARGSGDLTARDLVAALRAAAHGADATEILGENVRWEAMFASLLSVLLKKHLISDWEFVEELTKS